MRVAGHLPEKASAIGSKPDARQHIDKAHMESENYLQH